MTDRWRDAWQRAKLGWPALDVPEGVFVAFARERDLNPERADAPSDARWTDLYLACACACADPIALGIFETHILPDVDLIARRGNVTPALLDELKQSVREKLFVARGDARPKIHDYSGTGDLRKWVRMVALRIWLNNTGRGAREIPHEDRMLEGLLGSHGDPELEYIKRLYTRQFKQAFGEAFASLDARSKNLIRYAFVDGLILEQIGIVYGVSRSSAARWVEKAHAELTSVVRKRLMKELGMNGEEYESLFRLIQSRLTLSLETFASTREPR